MKKIVLTFIPLLVFFLCEPLFAAESDTGQANQVAALMVNINEASAEELAEGLSGVGEGRANAIVEYRKLHGPFVSVESLTEVKGIGEATLAANASRIEL